MLRFIIAKPLKNVLFFRFLGVKGQQKLAGTSKTITPPWNELNSVNSERERGREKQKEEMNCNGTGNGCDVLACWQKEVI